MTARRWGAGMIVACVPVPRSAIPGNDYLGIIRVLTIPPCGCRLTRCLCHTAPHAVLRIAVRYYYTRTSAHAGRGHGAGVAASPRDRTPRPHAPLPPRVGPTGAGHAVPVGRGGRPANAATGDAYRLMSVWDI